ncbi:MAG: recombination protein O N-terminal domain-containing protein [bacterium]|nr:recombination protein O N-terminal domain-containing protein [bacterium]
MKEYVTNAIVLGRHPYREQDWVVDLFTESFGPIAARVVGGARTRSKLSPHLDAATLVLTRLVKANRFTVTDVATLDRFPALRADPAMLGRVLELLALVRRLAPPHVADPHLWQHLTESFGLGTASVAETLALLGHDPRGVRCGRCGASPAAQFVFPDHLVFCDACARPFPFLDRVRV